MAGKTRNYRCSCCGGAGPPTAVTCADCLTSWPDTLYAATSQGTATLTASGTGAGRSWAGCITTPAGIPVTFSLLCDPTFGLLLSLRWPVVGRTVGGNCSSSIDFTPTTVNRYDGSTFTCDNTAAGTWDIGPTGTCLNLLRVPTSSLAPNTATCATPVNLSYPIAGVGQEVPETVTITP